MEKDQFLLLLSHNSSLTEEETTELALLQDKFPYSQVIHNLVARGAQLNNLSDKQSALTRAAVYATDRAVLKSFITSLPAARTSLEEKTVSKVEKIIPEKEKVAVAKKPESIPKDPIRIEPVIEKIEKKEIEKIIPKVEFKGSELGGDELIDELFQDLDQLKKLKHDFEVAVQEFDKAPLTKAETPKDKPTIKEEKKEGKVKQRPDKITEGIIAEIKNTKKKIKPSDPKQKEQLEIINQFIKSEPIIGKNKGTVNPDTTDLSENSGVFTDNIVSETLVEILIKQGKKEKAIEVLRKLIWKFPQKKAYFAAQIEELTS